MAFVRALPAGAVVRVKLHAFESYQPPPTDQDTKLLFILEGTAEDIAKDWPRGRLDQDTSLDKLLTVLHDALFFEQCLRWQKLKVPNLPCDETPTLASWFLKGMSIADKPLFDGLCAMCATLLYGALYDHSGNGNRKLGQPVD